MSNSTQPDHAMTMLTQALQLLAADYAQQVQALPDFVNLADELALTFDDAYQLFEQVDRPQVQRVGAQHNSLNDALKRIDQHFEAMQGNQSFWTAEQVRHGESWNRVRTLAHAALTEMGVKHEEPVLNSVTYVRDNRRETPYSPTRPKPLVVHDKKDE